MSDNLNNEFRSVLFTNEKIVNTTDGDITVPVISPAERTGAEKSNLNQRDSIDILTYSVLGTVVAGATIACKYYQRMSPFDSTGASLAADKLLSTETKTLGAITVGNHETSKFTSADIEAADYFTITIVLKQAVGANYTVTGTVIVKKKNEIVVADEPELVAEFAKYPSKASAETITESWTFGKALITSGIEVTVTNKNKHKTYLVDGTEALFRRGTFYWNGSAYVADNSYFVGIDAGTNSSGSSCNGLGKSALNANVGNSCNGIGNFSLGANTANNCNVVGDSAGYKNSGTNLVGIGQAIGYQNANNDCIGMGYYTLQLNNWANVIQIGSAVPNAFSENTLSTKEFEDTEITSNTITFVAPHGFGSTGRKINLKYKTLLGTPPTGLVNNTIYQFTITSASIMTLAGIGTNASADFKGSLTNSVDVTNSVAIGHNTVATKANQTVIGNDSTTETRIRGAINYIADTASTDAYVVTFSPAMTAYNVGSEFTFKAVTANTDGATINVNGLGAKTIVKGVSTALATNDILAGMMCKVMYDGTNFVLFNPRTL